MTNYRYAFVPFISFSIAAASPALSEPVAFAGTGPVATISARDPSNVTSSLSLMRRIKAFQNKVAAQTVKDDGTLTYNHIHNLQLELNSIKLDAGLANISAALP